MTPSPSSSIVFAPPLPQQGASVEPSALRSGPAAETHQEVVGRRVLGPAAGAVVDREPAVRLVDEEGVAEHYRPAGIEVPVLQGVEARAWAAGGAVPVHDEVAGLGDLVAAAEVAERAGHAVAVGTGHRDHGARTVKGTDVDMKLDAGRAVRIARRCVREPCTTLLTAPWNGQWLWSRGSARLPLLFPSLTRQSTSTYRSLRLGLGPQRRQVDIHRAVVVVVDSGPLPGVEQGVAIGIRITVAGDGEPIVLGEGSIERGERPHPGPVEDVDVVGLVPGDQDLVITIAVHVPGVLVGRPSPRRRRRGTRRSAGRPPT